MSRTLTLPGTGWSVEYDKVGEGPVLVYLHGAFGLEWSMPLVHELARSHTVIAPCMPGYGTSDGLDRIGSFYDLSVWLDEVLDVLKLDSVALAGHDFGGAAAAEYAALFRRRVRELALVTPYGLWPEGDPMPDIFALTPGALTKLLFADPTGPFAGAFNIQHPDKARQDEAILSRRQAMIAAAKLLWPIPDKGLRHRLYRIQAPTIVIGGAGDELMSESYIRAFARGIVGAQVAMVEAGHMVPQEAPQAAAASISTLSQKVPA